MPVQALGGLHLFMVSIDPDKVYRVLTVGMAAQAFSPGTTAPRDGTSLREKRSIKISYLLSEYSPTHLTIDLLS